MLKSSHTLAYSPNAPAQEKSQHAEDFRCLKDTHPKHAELVKKF